VAAAVVVAAAVALPLQQCCSGPHCGMDDLAITGSAQHTCWKYKKPLHSGRCETGETLTPSNSGVQYLPNLVQHVWRKCCCFYQSRTFLRKRHMLQDCLLGFFFKMIHAFVMEPAALFGVFESLCEGWASMRERLPPVILW
jgi:hypothetical protein